MLNLFIVVRKFMVKYPYCVKLPTIVDYWPFKGEFSLAALPRGYKGLLRAMTGVFYGFTQCRLSVRNGNEAHDNNHLWLHFIDISCCYEDTV